MVRSNRFEREIGAGGELKKNENEHEPMTNQMKPTKIKRKVDDRVASKLIEQNQRGDLQPALQHGCIANRIGEVVGSVVNARA